MEDPMPSVSPISARLTVREIQERANVPKMLYGLDYEEDYTPRPVEEEPAHHSVVEPTNDVPEETPRVWQVYNKERLYVTADRSPTYTPPQGSSFHAQTFLTSLLFKLGSVLYLASTAVMCLDVIILHRLFNFSSAISQKVGGALRMFLLLLAFIAMGTVLLGGNIYPFKSPEAPPPVVGPLPPPPPPPPPPVVAPPPPAPPASAMPYEYKVKLKSIEDELKEKNATMKELWNHLKNLTQLVSAGAEEHRKKVEEIEAYKGQLKKMESKLDEKDVRIDELNITVETLTEKVANADEDKTEMDIEAYNSQLKKIESNLDKKNAEINDLSNSLDNLTQTVEASADEDETKKEEIGQLKMSLKDLKELFESVKKDLEVKVKPCSCGIDEKILENLKQEIKAIVNMTVESYYEERVGTFDFLLENSGGSVMLDHCSPTYAHSVAKISLFGVALWHIPSSPKVIIQPSHHPGDCWAMAGQSGYATVKMSAEAVVTSVTVDHIPENLSPNRSRTSAPNHFKVYGLQSIAGESRELGEFQYDLDGPSVQTFNIDEAVQGQPSQFVRFEFSDNYGNDNFTCIYRIRAHGHYP